MHIVLASISSFVKAPLELKVFSQYATFDKYSEFNTSNMYLGILLILIRCWDNENIANALPSQLRSK